MTKTEMTTRVRGGVEGRLVPSSIGSFAAAAPRQGFVE